MKGVNGEYKVMLYAKVTKVPVYTTIVTHKQRRAVEMRRHLHTCLYKLMLKTNLQTRTIASMNAHETGNEIRMPCTML